MSEIQKRDTQPEGTPKLLVFLAYLAYLRAMRPPPPPENKAIRWLVLALIVIALVANGAADEVAEVIRYFIPIP